MSQEKEGREKMGDGRETQIDKDGFKGTKHKSTKCRREQFVFLNVLILSIYHLLYINLLCKNYWEGGKR